EFVFRPDGQHLLTWASGFGDGAREIQLWDTKSGRAVWGPFSPAGTVHVHAFSPDGTRLVLSERKAVQVWDAATGQGLWTLLGHQEGVFAAAFSPDGRRLATAAGRYPENGPQGLIEPGLGEVKVWDATSTPDARVLPGHDLLNNWVAFSPDGR